jgi:hypothetical protein
MWIIICMALFSRLLLFLVIGLSLVSCGKTAEAPAVVGPPPAWSQVKAGMDRSQLEAITGDSPTKEGMVNVGGVEMEEMVWVSGSHSLTVRGRGGVSETVEVK